MGSVTSGTSVTGGGPVSPSLQRLRELRERSGALFVVEPLPVATVTPIDPVARVQEALSTVGWIRIKARAQGGRLVVFVRDSTVTLPAAVARLPRFSVAELEMLVDAGATREDVTAITDAKATLGGTVVEFKREESR